MPCMDWRDEAGNAIRVIAFACGIIYGVAGTMILASDYTIPYISGPGFTIYNIVLLLMPFLGGPTYLLWVMVGGRPLYETSKQD